MNYRTMVKGALALSLSLTVASAFAATTYSDVQKYGATFENAINTTVGELNDYAYELNSGITNQNYRDEQAAKGWFAGSADDESKIITRADAAGGQALQLNTDANTLTNKFSSTVAGAVNTAIGNQGTAFFETDVKFVASDTLDAGITGGQDATKFAIYAYCDDQAETVTTNLVVFHAYYDTNDEIAYTNEIFDVAINTEVYTKLRIDMKQMENLAGDPINVFSVKVGNGEALTSDLAFDEGKWFITVEDPDDEDAAEISSLNFKGTGEIDNISVGTITETTTYAVDWSGSDKVVVSNDVAQLLDTPTNLTACTITFYPTEGTITNINGVAQDPGLASYQVDISSDTNLVVLAGEVSQPPAGDDYDAVHGDTVNGESISAAVAAWLNGIKGNATKAAFEETLDNDGYTLTEEYLLNTDPTEDTTVDFTVSSIAVGDKVDLQVTLARTEDNAAVETAINGQLQILGAATLDSSFNATNALPSAKFSGGTPAETSLTTQSKFFKAIIVEAPAVQQ